MYGTVFLAQWRAEQGKDMGIPKILEVSFLAMVNTFLSHLYWCLPYGLQHILKLTTIVHTLQYNVTFLYLPYALPLQIHFFSYFNISFTILNILQALYTKQLINTNLSMLSLLHSQSNGVDQVNTASKRSLTHFLNLCPVC